jgi:hypothetical protein
VAGFVSQQLVLVRVGVTAERGKSFSVGTGYFVTADLVLTAGHVVPEHAVTDLKVRTEQDGEWRTAALPPVWRDTVLDAVLLRVEPALPEAPKVAWVETEFDADAQWHSSGYPAAGRIEDEGKALWKTVGLSGKLQAHGGGGQGRRELELTVDAPPPAEQWSGISGAPVFVGERLAGFITEVPKSFQGGRLAAIPATALFLNHGFRLALSPSWLEPLPQGVWVMVVLSESKKGKVGLGEWTDNALSYHAKALEPVVGLGIKPKALRVSINDALQSPGHWLHFVKALCSAPIAIFDATGFEAAVMLALGVRSAVRRGVTITSTADVLTPEQLKQLPFNIQETKLIHHGSGYAPADPRHPLKAIGESIKKGWQELESQPNYLDLPAYDAVRCPYPAPDADGNSAIERILVLCPFSPDHAPNWLHLANALVARYPNRQAARMLEVTSPRLVGQALYEGIRWARTCVVDWTAWRANVFFEMGVRTACADVGPVCLIEASTAEAALSAGAPLARRQLMALFVPAVYRIDPNDDAIANALAVHDAIVNDQVPPVGEGALPHDAAFRTCRDYFEWKQEHITIEPHELLRSTIEAPFGKDPQAGGRSPLLFSANADYSRELDRSVKERWIAAWYYLNHRYPRTRWAEDRGLRAALRKLGNDVLQFGLPSPKEPHLVALRDEIFDVLDELDGLDQPQSSDG